MTSNHNSTSRLSLAALTTALVLGGAAACGGNDTGALAQGPEALGAADAGATTDAGTVLLACDGGVTLTAVQNDIFTPSCSGCHSGSTPKATLDLSAGNAFAQLVNVASALDATHVRVVPGNAQGSFLFQKVTNTQSASDGRVMPPGSNTPLTPAQVNEVGCWINDGALNN